MHEITVNLHMHTFFSDGHATHEEIARAALHAVDVREVVGQEGQTMSLEQAVAYALDDLAST